MSNFEFPTPLTWLQSVQAVAIATFVLTALIYAPQLKYKRQIAIFPVILENLSRKQQQLMFISSARKLYKDGFEQFKNSVYRMRAFDGEQLVLPNSLLPELRRIPDDTLGYYETFTPGLEVKYTKLDIGLVHVVPEMIKRDLTPKLSTISPIMSAEVDSAIQDYLPSCQEWVEVDIAQVVLDVVARVTGRFFAGPDLASDPEYLECAKSFTIRLTQALQAIKAIPTWLRPFLAPRSPEVRLLLHTQEKMKSLIERILRERHEAMTTNPNWAHPEDMIQWLLERSDANSVTSQMLTSAQLMLIKAAVHTTTQTLLSVLQTLAVTPQYVQPLREEIRAAMTDDVTISAKTLQQFPKMDSYIKEVVRVYPSLITPYFRLVRKGITLSNGQYLPPGATIVVPDPRVTNFDSATYSDSETFDGFRHYNLCNNGSKESFARHQWLVTNETNLGWGYGSHICPGRFFANNLIKLVLAKIISDYDIKMPRKEADGLEGRYPVVDIGPVSLTPPGQILMLSRVQS